MSRHFFRLALSGFAVLIVVSSVALAQTRFTPPLDKPGARARYEYEQLKDPATGLIPAGIRAQELAFSAMLPDRMTSGTKNPATQAGLWTARGPFTVGGRTRAFAIDIANENNLLAGGVLGGVWRSIDGGQSWVRTTRLDQTPSVTCLVQDIRAGKRNVWYYGTGERRGSASDIRGDGIFKSTDNGLTWQALPSTVSGTPQQQNDFDFIWRLAVDPSVQDKDVVYAAAVGGIFRSTDGGTTWTLVLGVRATAGSPAEMTDIVVTSKGVAYATLSERASSTSSAVKGIYRSTDGINWKNITPAGFPGRYNRIVPAVAPSDENIVYFLGEALQSNHPHCFYKYTYLSGDGSGTGGQWDDRSLNVPSNDDWLMGFNSQGSYNLAIAVHPTFSDVVAIGGTNVMISGDGFASTIGTLILGGYNPEYSGTLEGWKDMMYPNHHSDIHTITFLPSNPAVMFTTGDGGIHKTEDYQTSPVPWIPLNNGYATTQFYTVAINQYTSGDQTVIGGLQDNHTFGSAGPGSHWEWLAGGDGSYCAIPPDNSGYYVSAQFAYLCRTTVDAQFRYTGIELMRTDSLGEQFQFIAPFLLDPNDPDVMYLASYQSIWRLTDANGSSPRWTRAVQVSNIAIGAIAVSKQPANVLYYSTMSGRMYRRNNANQAGGPIDITGSQFPQNGFINCVAVDPEDANKVLVVFSSYNIPSLFYTENGGTTWTNVSGNLEENPNGTGAGPACYWAEFVHVPGGTLFLVGTSVGLFSAEHLSTTTQWVKEGATSIGTSPVRMIRARQSDGFVAVATHGGGIFTASITGVSPVGEKKAPEVLYLEQTYPNPSNDKSLVRFSVPRTQHISIKVYDAFGSVLATIADGSVEQGHHTATLDTRQFAAGRYYIRMETEGFAQTRLLTVVH